jgi:hypothetical protein
MQPDAGRHDEAIHEGWSVDPLLLITVLCPLGILVWIGLFLAIRWSVGAAWAAVVG